MEIYGCDICEKTYNSTKHLLIHFKKVHQFTGNFECMFCGLKFSKRCNLIRHLKNVHEENNPMKSHQCKVCNVILYGNIRKKRGSCIFGNFYIYMKLSVPQPELYNIIGSTQNRNKYLLPF